MSYYSDKTSLNANAAKAGEIMHGRFGGMMGDSQVVIRAKAVDTGFTSGDPVSIWPTVSGYYVDGIVNDTKQYVGICKDTPGAAGDEIDVVIGGFCRANMSTSHTMTAWAGTIEFTSNTLYYGVTVHTTNSIGWIVSSGTCSTAGTGVIFLDRPWDIIDTTS